MSTPIGEAFVRIRPNTTGFRAEAETGMKGAFSGLGKLLGGALAVGGLVEFGKHAAEAAMQEQSSMAAVHKAVENVNAAWVDHGKTVDHVLVGMAQKSGQTVPDLAQGFLRLVTATHSTGKALKDLQLVEDVSIARHMGVAQAALAVSKAEQGSATGLQRLGIVVPKLTSQYDLLKHRHDEATASGIKFSKQQELDYKAMLKTAQAADKQATSTKVLAVLQERFGGQTARFAETAAGKMAIAEEQLHLFVVSLGEHALPLLAAGFGGLARWGMALEHNQTIQHDASETIKYIGDAFHLVAEGAQAAWPVVEKVGEVLHDAVSAIGVPEILVGVAAYKSVAIAMDLAAAAEAKWASFMAIGTAAEEAQATEAEALLAALSANTAAMEANTLAVQGNVAAASEATIIYGSMGEVLAVVGETASATAAELDAVAVGEAAIVAEGASVGILSGLGASLAEIATGPVGIGLALAGVAIGLYKLMGQESDVERANDSLKQSFNQLRGSEDSLQSSTAALNSALSALPTAKIALQTSTLNVEQAKSALGHSSEASAVLKLTQRYQAHNLTQAQFIRLAGQVKGSLDFREKVNQLVSALDSQRVAQRQVNETEKTIDKERAARHTALLTRYSAEEHEIARAGRLADEVARKGRVLDGINGGAAAAYGGKITDLIGGADMPTANMKLAVAQVKDFASALKSDLTPQLQKQQPLVAHNIQLLSDFAKVIGHLPKPKEIKLILTNKDAKAGLDDIVKATGEKLANGKTQAELGTQKMTAAVQSKLQAEAGPAGEAGATLGSMFMQGIAGEVDTWTAVIASKLTASLHAITAAGKHGIQARSPSDLTAKELGVPMMQGIAEGFRREERNTRAQLELAIKDSITGGRESIRQAVQGAHANLSSLGDTIGSDIGQFIDAGLQRKLAQLDTGPLSRKIKALETKIRLESEHQNTASLTRGLETARANLASALQAQSSTPLAGETAEQYRARVADAAKQAIDAQQAVADAQRAIAENQQQLRDDALNRRLQAEKDHAQKVADIHKAAAARRVSNLTEELNRGLISERTYQRELGKILGANGVTYRALGRQMGLAFADQFRAQMRGLVAQEKALLAGPHMPGVTGFEPSITRPIEAVKAAILSVEQAKAARDKEIIAELKKLNKAVSGHGHKKPGGGKHSSTSKTHTVTDAQAQAILTGGAKR